MSGHGRVWIDKVALRRTTGGAGGKVVVVSTLSEFSSAVSEKNTAPVIVVVNGTITGNTKIKVGSNKTIIGLPGSGEYSKKLNNTLLR